MMLEKVPYSQHIETVQIICNKYLHFLPRKEDIRILSVEEYPAFDFFPYSIVFKIGRLRFSFYREYEGGKPKVTTLDFIRME